MQVESILANVEKDLEEAQAQLRAAEGRVSELESVRHGLRLAIERYGVPTPSLPLRVAAGTEGAATAQLTQIDAAEAVLREMGRPATGYEIHERLTAAGRTESYEQIRSAMGYLNRMRRVRRVGRGLWDMPIPADEPTATESSVDHGPEVVAAVDVSQQPRLSETVTSAAS